MADTVQQTSCNVNNEVIMPCLNIKYNRYCPKAKKQILQVNEIISVYLPLLTAKVTTCFEWQEDFVIDSAPPPQNQPGLVAGIAWGRGGG